MAKSPKKLTKTEVAGVLATTALNVAGGAASRHPVDIAVAMANAVEYGAETLVALRDLGLIDWER